MIGDVRSETALSGAVAVAVAIQGDIASETVLAGVSIGPVEIIRGALPYYEGEYEAIPTVNEQVFPTSHTTMVNNFVVHQIPYYETSNPSGGYTAIIGG